MTRIPSPDTPPRPGLRSWTLGDYPWQAIPPVSGARYRVIIDNDFSGDPDDLFQLVHHLLSPNVDIRAVVASHLSPGDPFDPSPASAQNADAVARDVFARMGLASHEVIARGANDRLVDRQTPQASAAAAAIVAEAMRDADTPLLYLAGGGLTDLASALLIEPRIADRMTLVWIGGNEHDDLASPPPEAMPIEYNLLIDVTAAQVVFNDSTLPIWQVPRNMYRQCLVSEAELRLRVANQGALGRYLYDELAEVQRRAAGQGRGPGETYALGDSPLVLVSALQSLFEADSSSSLHVTMPTPELREDGSYAPRPDARPLRVFTWLDTRLMFEDMFLKLAEFVAWSERRHDGH
ncbi:nucleoside hydrolase [Microbacterium excoecariae]|uniref:nucleoside hydrolase n=1 Tax=Microbacterium excoecariae TaxID=2715210 RepID=UPI00140724DC|nr:nucleoside hydrolase [Microbacterium excoecariae]NHI15759.1 nucleoside hydrolase [Microbacterium excoecariae]